jgi:hypothetical protein
VELLWTRSTWRARDAEEVVDKPLEVGDKLLEVAEKVGDVRDDVAGHRYKPKSCRAMEESKKAEEVSSHWNSRWRELDSC